jgi:hypothetical protein
MSDLRFRTLEGQHLIKFNGEKSVEKVMQINLIKIK